MDLTVNQRSVAVNEQGFLRNYLDWDEDVAVQLASENNMVLTDEQWEIILFMRSYYGQYHHLPNMRMFIKAISKALGEGKGNSRYLHRLFPDSPLKYACKLAGLPKPPHCL